jgi:hypothetical protein
MWVAIAGCAGPGAGGEPGDVAAFQGVRSVAVVRRLERQGPRAKDALDGVEESLAGHGLAARVVDVPPRPPRGLAPLAALNDAIAQRVVAEFDPLHRRALPRRAPGAADAVAALGVDAAVFHVRPGLRFGPLGPVGPLGAPLDPRAQDRPLSASERLEALAVAARDGTVTWIAWDVFDEQPLPGRPANAFEAIEELLQLLGVTPPRPPDELDDPPR